MLTAVWNRKFSGMAKFMHRLPFILFTLYWPHVYAHIWDDTVCTSLHRAYVSTWYSANRTWLNIMRKLQLHYIKSLDGWFKKEEHKHSSDTASFSINSMLNENAALGSTAGSSLRNHLNEENRELPTAQICNKQLSRPWENYVALSLKWITTLTTALDLQMRQ